MLPHNTSCAVQDCSVGISAETLGQYCGEWTESEHRALVRDPTLTSVEGWGPDLVSAPEKQKTLTCSCSSAAP